MSQGSDYVYRGLRGGSFDDYRTTTTLQASSRYIAYYDPSGESVGLGFRVAEAVPEPASLLVLGSGILALAGMIRRKRNG